MKQRFDSCNCKKRRRPDSEIQVIAWLSFFHNLSPFRVSKCEPVRYIHMNTNIHWIHDPEGRGSSFVHKSNHQVETQWSTGRPQKSNPKCMPFCQIQASDRLFVEEITFQVQWLLMLMIKYAKPDAVIWVEEWSGKHHAFRKDAGEWEKKNKNERKTYAWCIEWHT